MKKAAIIGGKLQGVEACYLAQKANIKTILIDVNPKVPASGIADEFVCMDVCAKSHDLITVLKEVDFILPAMENDNVLHTLQELQKEENLNVAFDFDAYAVSSSKVRSDQLIRQNNIPAPVYYPDCLPPYIVKPNSASGSDGVCFMQTVEEVETFFASVPKGEDWVAQEFLNGKSYSIEVIGKPGNYQTYEVTEIHMDDGYDCKKVTAPCAISESLKQEFSQIGIRLAELVNLKGIMDVEVILDKEKLKVLEIDARIPSQTPTVVYHSTGVNFIEKIAELFCDGQLVEQVWKEEWYSSFEHFVVQEGKIEGLGEHVMSERGPLHCYENHLGADEVITDYQQGDKEMIGTFINRAKTKKALEKKRLNMLSTLKELLIEGRLF